MKWNLCNSFTETAELYFPARECLTSRQLCSETPIIPTPPFWRILVPPDTENPE
ncbi:MAG: hypothetical protein WCP55_03920 [Lentisphaerota bacterium]